MAEQPSSVVVSLFEGDYVLGLGALLNSLWRHGFDGEFRIGYRGDLNRWVAMAKPAADGAELMVPGGGLVRFIRLDTDWHLTNRKPYVLSEFWPATVGAVFYFDPDIVNKARWSFYEEWVGYGIPMVADPVMDPMPADHPYRMAWAQWLNARGFEVRRWPTGYYNGGFVGFSTDRRDDVETWCRIHDHMATEVPMDRIGPVPRTDLFCMTDQDAMNMLAMVTPGPLSTMGPEGMDFVPGGTVMSHAAGGVKPWCKRYIRSALGGVPPTLADKAWLANTRGPIEVLSASEYRKKAREIRIASAIGRFVRRA